MKLRLVKVYPDFSSLEKLTQFSVDSERAGVVVQLTDGAKDADLAVRPVCRDISVDFIFKIITTIKLVG